MEVVTKYRANDGSEWASADEAIAREQQILMVNEAMRPLGERPDDEGCRFSNGEGFRRHSLARVRQAKAALIALTRPHVSAWMDGQEKGYGRDMMDVHPSWFLRMLDGASRPLERAWGRLSCIDDEGREWGQPYFASNPQEATQVEV